MLSRAAGYYSYFIPKTLGMCREDPWAFLAFLLVATLTALSEGVSLTLLIPILQAQGGHQDMTQVPFIGRFLTPFEGLPPGQFLVVMVTLLAVVLVARGLLQYWNGVLSVTLPLRLRCKLMSGAYAALVEAQLPFVEGKDIGVLHTYVDDHGQRVSSAIKAFVDGLFSLGVIAVYAALMLSLSWPMTLVAFGFVSLLAVVVKVLLISPLEGIGRGLSDAQGRLRNQFFETIHGLRLIALTGAGPRMRQRFDTAVHDYYRHDRHRLVVAISQSPILMTGAGLFICALLFVSARVATPDDTSWMSPLLVFVMALYRMLTPAIMVNNAHATIASNIHSFQVLDAFLEEAKRQRQPSGGIAFDGLTDGIVLDGVSLAYPDRNTLALDNITLRLPRHRMVALVGPSGAGKTSIIGLLTRFYDPTRGRVMVDGRDLPSYDLRDWRRRISVVTQQAILFNDTVTANLCFGLNDVPMDKVRRAARLAAAEEFIETLPQGYDTVLGDKGARLSGGQQQRLAIARAILQDPDLLILDEATSQLDSLTEKVVQDTLDGFRGVKTILVVAHRLSTIQRADWIVVMDKGRVVEEGRHENLFAASGTYRHMLDNQRLILSDKQ